MELRHLRCFITVAEAGSLTAAAQRMLHTSQPSLSRQIRDLEDEVGAQLLTRRARGVAHPAKPCFSMGFLTGDTPTVELVLGYKKSNESPILKLLLSRLDELVARVSN